MSRFRCFIAAALAVLLSEIAAPAEAQSLRIRPAIISANAAKMAAAKAQAAPQQVATGKQLRARRTRKYMLIGAGIGFVTGAWVGYEFGSDTGERPAAEVWKGELRAGAIGAVAGWLFSR